VVSQLPDLLTGVYQHYKGPLYLVLGYGHDANHEDRQVVVYIDGAHTEPRLAVRDVDDFFAIVDSADGSVLVNARTPSLAHPRRFTYLGSTWENDVALWGEDDK